MVKIHTVTLDGKVYSLGFKVVTLNLESLGLRKNPNIVKYAIGEWYSLPSNQVRNGPNDFGGIWVARTLSGARGLRGYMRKQYSQETRIFRVALGEILYFNSYCMKTDRVNMFEEVFQD